MNAKPGWPIFATILCFCVVGALTLNSYQLQNRRSIPTLVSDTASQAPAIMMIADDTASAPAKEETFVFPVVDEIGCSIEEQLAGTADIGSALIVQQQMASAEQSAFTIDPAAIESAIQFAADLARTALMRGGFGLRHSTSGVEPLETGTLDEQHASGKTMADADHSTPDHAEPTSPGQKIRAKLASFRLKRSSPANSIPTATWETSMEKLSRMQDVFKLEAARMSTKIKAQYELHHLRQTLQKIGQRVRETWVGEMIQRVVAPRPQSEFHDGLDLNTYAAI